MVLKGFIHKFQRFYPPDDGFMFFKSFNENIKVIGVIDKVSQEQDYLQQLTGKIYCIWDLDSNTLVLKEELEGWIPIYIRIWPSEENAKKWNMWYSTSLYSSSSEWITMANILFS